MLQAGSISQIFDFIRNHNSRIRTVSFDVFDTLLLRRIHPPDIIHERVAQQLASIIGYPSWEVLLNKRYEVEQRLRKISSESGLDHECDFESILKEWITSLNIFQPGIIEQLTKYELQLEKDALYPQEHLIVLLKWLLEKEIKIFALSDIYLNSRHLLEIFDHFQIKSFFNAIYSSADRRLCKYSSKLFDILIQEQKIDRKTHLHIGDNRVSDFLAPRKLLMNSIYLHEPRWIARRARLRTYKSLAERNSLFKGKYFCEVLTDGPRKHFSNFYERYGYEVLGPIFSLWGLGLMEKLQKNDYDFICFLARDGHLLKQIAEKLVQAGFADSSIQDRFKYLHVSRKTGFAALAGNGLTVEQARVGLYSPTQRGLESILRTFSLPVTPFEKIAGKYSFDEIGAPISNFLDKRLGNFFADQEVQQIICRENEKHKSIFLSYLKQEGILDSKRVAFVDIGWNGTIQYSLHQLTKNWSKRPIIDGYYFAYSSGIGYQMPDNWISEGIIHDSTRKHPGERSAVHFEEIFEEAARSLEGSTVGYQNGSDSIQPILKPEDAEDRIEERKRDQEILDLQKGIIDCLDEFIKAQRLTGYGFQELKPFFTYHLERAMIYPTSSEVFHLSRLTHANDFGLDTMMNLESIRTRQASVFQYQQFLQEVSTSEWIYGKMTGFWFNLPRYVMRVRELWRSNGRV